MREPLGGDRERPNEYGVLHEGRKADRRTGVECLHKPPRQSRGDPCAQRFPKECYSSSEDDDVRMEQVHRVREGVSHGFGHLVEDLLGTGISLGQGWPKCACFSALSRPSGHRPRKQASGIRSGGSLDHAIDGPSRAKRLGDFPTPFKAQVAQLNLAGRRSMINPTLRDKPTAHTAARVHP